MKSNVVRLDSDLLNMRKQVVYVTDICQCVRLDNLWHDESKR